MREGQNIKAARRLRQVANAPEAVAWNVLRRLRESGVAVRRQHPIGGYIVDFAIARRKIVIEIDGGVHRLEEVALRDAERQTALESLGWRVIRIEAVAAMNADYLLAFTQRELGL